MSDIKTFFSASEQAAIVEAIMLAEKNTSGEIKLHLESTTNGELVLQKASTVFDNLEMEKTKHGNAVLIYMAIDDRSFAIWAGRGINLAVPQGYWESTVDLMKSYFKADQFATGITKGIHMIGTKLKQYYPIEANDQNELSNDISFGS